LTVSPANEAHPIVTPSLCYVLRAAASRGPTHDLRECLRLAFAPCSICWRNPGRDRV